MTPACDRAAACPWLRPQRGLPRAGKAEADQRVERSLYQRAVGYSFDSVKIFMPAGAKKPVYAPYREHAPPDTTAAIFWLQNGDPAHWRDAWQLEHVTGKYIISDKPITEDEWIKQRAVVVDGDDAVDVTPTKRACVSLVRANASCWRCGGRCASSCQPGCGECELAGKPIGRN